MSSGDVDDTLGPAGELEQLRKEYPDLDRYLAMRLDIEPIIAVRDYSIPYLGGIGVDGNIPYLDARFNPILEGTDISPATCTHEIVEWALRTFCSIGVNYASDPRGHRLANRAEYDRVAAILGGEPEEAWERYDSFMDPQILFIEHAPIVITPPDLAMYPYEGTSLYQKIVDVRA